MTRRRISKAIKTQWTRTRPCWCSCVVDFTHTLTKVQQEMEQCSFDIASLDADIANMNRELSNAASIGDLDKVLEIQQKMSAAEEEKK